MDTLLVLAGVGQLALALVSLAIPAMLGWREETKRLEPLTRAVFWTYASYIWGTNVCMGLVSTIGAHWLLSDTPLAKAVCGFIALYWGARLLIQWFVFRKHAPPGRIYVLAEWGLSGLFAFLTAVYGWVTIVH